MQLPASDTTVHAVGLGARLCWSRQFINRYLDPQSKHVYVSTNSIVFKDMLF